jgi:hypothetical protein
MPRRIRCDYPGAWHHVFNRAVAKRTLFDSQDDYRFFLSRLAREVRAGRLEVHVFSVLANHLKVCRNPWDYPFGSARWYLRSNGPPWLSREVVESIAGRRDGEPWDPALYIRSSSVPLSDGERWLAERRAREAEDQEEDPLDEVLGATTPAVLAWMDKKARLADGTRPGHVLVSPESLLRTVDSRRERTPGRGLRIGPRTWPFWEVLEAGSLRECSALSFEELESRLGLSRGTLQRRLRMHGQAMDADPLYREEVAEILIAATRQDHPGRTFSGRHRSGVRGDDGTGGACRAPRPAIR